MERRLHRSVAIALCAFVAVHLVNHALGVLGAGLHIATMQKLRGFYRHPVVEVLLLGLVLTQVALGLRLAWRAWRKVSDGWGRAQLISGLYLAFFVTQHVAAALFSRHGGVDTDFHWAAGVVRSRPLAYYYLPYYAAAPIAFMTHVGIGLHWVLMDRLGATQARQLAIAFVVAGCVISALALTGLLGG